MKRCLLLVLSIMIPLSLVGCTKDKTPSSSDLPSSQSASSSFSSINTSSVVVNDYKPITYKIAEETDKFYVNGRTMAVSTADAQNGMLFDHAGQGLLFTADCEGDVSIDLALISEDSEGKDYQLFSVRVDGIATDVLINSNPTETVRTLSVAKDLPRGKHTFAIYRCNEAMLGRATLLTVKMNGLAENYVAPEGQLKMVFLGDSITAGHGTRAVNGAEDQYHNKYRDATYTYAFLCGEALNADFHLIARSGMATTGRPDATNNANLYYEYYSYERPERVKYDTSKEDVDIYVISLGTNDGGWSKKLVKANATALVERVRKDHPNAKIIWTYGQMATDYKDVYSSIIEELGGAEANLYFYMFSQPNRDGGATHPNAEAHAKYAKELTDFIRSIL